MISLIALIIENTKRDSKTKKKKLRQQQPNKINSPFSPNIILVPIEKVKYNTKIVPTEKVKYSTKVEYPNLDNRKGTSNT